MPVVTEMYAKNELGKFKSLYRSITRWIFLISFPIFLIFISYPHVILSILFGSEFAGAAGALRILSVGYFFFALSSLSWNTLIAVGKTKLNFYINVTVAAINFFINLMLIPTLGMIGAAIALAISLTIGGTFSIYLVRSLTKAQPFSLSLIKPTFAGLISAAAFLYLPGQLFAIPLWYVFLGAALFLASYVVLALTFRTLTEEDIMILKVIEAKTGLRLDKFKPFLKRFL
jgi:O-antigen/teichoic acid export membrane protein